MTECNRQSSSFSRLGRQTNTANFDGGRLTSDAGELLLREADRQLGLPADPAECIADPRDPATTTHDLKRLLRQRIFGSALGYEALNDHTTLRDDGLFAILAEPRPDPFLCQSWSDPISWHPLAPKESAEMGFTHEGRAI
ncbi:MAG: transposase [Planctomycetes bacterium]|nr:transposase [Planctomycetota bacterium]